jgi:hypothetical protein
VIDCQYIPAGLAAAVALEIGSVAHLNNLNHVIYTAYVCYNLCMLVHVDLKNWTSYNCNARAAKCSVVRHDFSEGGEWQVRPCLVCPVKVYRPLYRMFGHMHGVLNIDYLRN